MPPRTAPAQTTRRPPAPKYAGVVVPLRLRAGNGILNLFSTTTVFGTPVDVTLSELAIEAFYPADDATSDSLHGLAGT